MERYVINSFSGGIQESTSATDFSPRQWSQLKGIVPLNELTFESQWAIQTVGSAATGFVAVYPLASDVDLFLTAIKSDGTLWWCTAPSPDVSHTTSQAVTWSQITVAENRTWSSSTSTSDHGTIAVQANAEYRFICSLPLQVYKYVKDVDSTRPDQVVLDRDSTTAPRAVASAVLLDTRERVSNQQSLILYVNNATSSIKAIVFPAPRRIPVHSWKEKDDSLRSNFITTDFIYNNDRIGSDTMLDWPFNMSSIDAPEVKYHPYTYRDINGQLNPGTGLMPRANVGCMKGNLLILGDIEWRTNFSNVSEVKDSVPLLVGSNETTVGISPAKQVIWPSDLPKTGRVIFNSGPGLLFISKATFTTDTKFSVTRQEKNNGTVRLRLSSNPTSVISVSSTVAVSGVGPSFNGTHTVTEVGSNYIEYIFGSNTVSARSSAGTVTIATAGTGYDIQADVGEYVAIPDPDVVSEDWEQIWVSASVAGTSLRAAQNFNRGTHFLNDNNTGPHRGSLYYSESDIDTWDPRSVLKPSRTDVRIAGLHSLDDTVIVVTTAGSEGDGVLRIRGYLSQLHPYSEDELPDPTAVRIELIKGGVGAPQRADTGGHKNYSCVWSEAGLVVFIDRLGGVFYTDGQVCDRLDRYGPKQPLRATDADHVAALGKHLLVNRDGRLLCFTLLSSGSGTGSGCWTELIIPSGGIRSMVGIREDLYFVNASGQVMRFATLAPDVERGCIDGVAQTLTVSTATIGSQDEHARTNWHRFGMTFTTPTSCTVNTIRVQSTGALNVPGSVSAPDVSYSTTLDRTYNNPGILGEFIVPAGIGVQAVASATVTFTGYVSLQSASFWVTGSTPRQGDL
jgi:hypothetical protein